MFPNPEVPFHAFRTGCVLNQLSLFSRGRCHLRSPPAARAAGAPAERGGPGEGPALRDGAHSLSGGPGGSL